MSLTVDWYRMTPERKPKSWRARFGDYGIDSEGCIWIPAEIVGPGMAVVLCAGSDGTSLLRGPGGHVHVPIDWAIEGYSRTRNEDFAKVKARIREAHPEAFQRPAETSGEVPA